MLCEEQSQAWLSMSQFVRITVAVFLHILFTRNNIFTSCGESQSRFRIKGKIDLLKLFLLLFLKFSTVSNMLFNFFFFYSWTSGGWNSAKQWPWPVLKTWYNPLPLTRINSTGHFSCVNPHKIWETWIYFNYYGEFLCSSLFSYFVCILKSK